MSGRSVIPVETGSAVKAVFTTRHGGVSQPPFDTFNLATSTGDDPRAVRENRRLLCEQLDIAPERVSMLRQVHGDGVVHLTGPARPGRFCGGLVGWPEADGMVTDRPGLPLLIMAADCVPVVFWRVDGSGVGAAHAGWQGLMGGTIAAVRAALPGVGPVGAAIGPCIDQANYEVDQALARRFADRFGSDVADGRLIDLRACARISLQDSDVASGAIQSVEHSTAEGADFFSHRTNGPRTGRQSGVIWMADVAQNRRYEG
jgi:YfiH family protein